MKILLVNPLDKKNCAHFIVQPLGLMYIASALRERSNHEIKILDMKAHFLSDEQALQEIKSFSPDIVGIKTLTSEATAVHELTGKIKKQHPHSKIIIGGPHTHGSSNSILEDDNVDYVAIGEGEETAYELINEIEQGNDSPDVAGIGYRRNGKAVFTQPRQPQLDIDSLPFPAWDLIDMEKYYRIPSWNYHLARHMAIFTSRGCPFKCAYCHNIFGKKPRLRSPENVLQEIDTLYHDYGVRELKIIDDIFNVNKKRAQAICDGIIDRGYDLDICFPNGLRGDIMDRATIKKLKAAGTSMITYAIESASPRIQKLIKKNNKLDRLKEVIDETVEEGIFTKGFFMMGFPSETREEVHATANYALTSKLHWISIFVVNPFEGTKIADMAKEMGIHIDHSNMDFSGGYKVNPVQLGEMPVSEIKKLQFKTLYSFFLSPQRIFSSIRCTKSKKKLFLFMLTNFLRIFVPASKKDAWVRWFNYKVYDHLQSQNEARSRRLNNATEESSTVLEKHH